MTPDEIKAIVYLLRAESHRLHALMWPSEGPTVDDLFYARATERGDLDRERDWWVIQWDKATTFAYPGIWF